MSHPPWRDPLLAAAAATQVLTQVLTPITGDTVETVGSTVRRYNDASLAVQLRERMALAVLVGLLTWLLPVLARRSYRRWRGRPSTQGRLLVLFDAPWHRDPVLWTAAALMLLPLAAFTGLSGSGEESFEPGQPLKTKEVITGSYLDTFPDILQLAPAFLVAAVILGLIRLVFRVLGGQRPWSSLRTRPPVQSEP